MMDVLVKGKRRAQAQDPDVWGQKSCICVGAGHQHKRIT
jgi:hypothetical protein